MVKIDLELAPGLALAGVALGRGEIEPLAVDFVSPSDPIPTGRLVVAAYTLVSPTLRA